MPQPLPIQPARIASQKLFLVLFVCLLAAVPGCAPVARTPKTYSAVTQVSTYPALQMGLYKGDVTYAQLEQSGDFGIGTFEGMDGEMIALNGRFYQARGDGSVHPAGRTMKAPFATVHFFQGKRRVLLSESLQSYDQLKAYLTRHLPAANTPCAFKVAGAFSYLKLRSVAKQSEPFPLLSELIARQSIFEYRNVNGTLVGYWMPEYLADLNVPGYHFHFISDDRQRGGHMLECSLTEATVDIDRLDSVTLLIPQNAAFQSTDFTKQRK